MLKISIITPSFNSEKTIEKTIKSVISQSYKNIEYIIVDGASKDKTLEVVNKYKDKISHVISEPDRGISDAYNKGIKIASGDLIGIVASDDELLPDAIERLINVYDGSSDLVCGGIIVHEEGSGYRYYLSNPDLSRLEFENVICHPAVYVKKDAYEKYGLYDLQYKCGIDRELLFRFYRKGAKFQFIGEYLSLFNVGGISAQRPYAIGFLEDAKISLRYGVPKIQVYAFYIKKNLKYFVIKFLKAVKLWEFLLKLRGVKYLSQKEVSSGKSL